MTKKKNNLFIDCSANMRLWLVLLHIILVGTNLWVSAHFHEDLPEDNEFAEFEDFEDEKPKKAPVQPKHVEIEQEFEEDEALVEDDVDSEFDHFQAELQIYFLIYGLGIVKIRAGSFDRFNK